MTSDMKILLLIPPSDIRYEYAPSVGLMNLFLVAKDLGCAVELVDLTEYSYSKSVRKITSQRYDLVGVSCNFSNVAYSGMQYAQEIKKHFPDTVVVAGGHHATFVPGDFLNNGFDCVVYGEGELTFQEYLERLKAGETTTDLKGTYILHNGEIRKNPPRETIEDLDTLPINDYSEFDLEPYFKQSGIRFLQIMTARGCVHNCSYCSASKMWGRKFRQQSPQKIVDQFHYAKKLGVELIAIEDDDFGLQEKNVQKFCRLLIDQDTVIPWIMTIGSRSVREDLTLDLAAQAGCVMTMVSVESASPRILKAYRRPSSAEDNAKICRKLHDRGILVHNKGLIGHPDETVSEILSTYRHLRKTADVYHASILEPRPGTDFAEIWENKDDPEQYRLFGRGNAFLAKNKIVVYFLYRIMAVLYLSNPKRLYLALFGHTALIRYFYRKYYSMAYWGLRANILDLFHSD